MKILALNCGSSSIKYSLFDSQASYALLGRGSAERIGQARAVIYKRYSYQDEEQTELSLPDHRAAMQALFPVEKEWLSIDAVGHRVVHGGESFTAPTHIDQDVIKEIKALARFAPLHCHSNVIGIEFLQERLPHIPHVAVFDTAAHACLDPRAFMYALPLEYYEKYKIRRYGFHGINHTYMAETAAQLLKQPLEQLKIITCHLGNGCSITAFDRGKSIDNSMGMTPLEGLVMGSRCGDIDPAAILYLMEKEGLQTDDMQSVLNKKSGLLGLCGKSDMRDIAALALRGEKAAQKAVEIFVYRVQKYIGAYVAALNGIEALVFSGGIGENSPSIRSAILHNFSYLQAFADAKANEANALFFATADSKVHLLTIPANEELVIAKQTQSVC